MRRCYLEVWEKINYLLKEKALSKQDFITKLLALEPKLKRTGEVPSASTINGYLYGKREIKIELIPFIAEALEIQEQELFNFQIEHELDYNLNQTKNARQLLMLLKYAPNSYVEHLIENLTNYKKLYIKNTK